MYAKKTLTAVLATSLALGCVRKPSVRSDGDRESTPAKPAASSRKTTNREKEKSNPTPPWLLDEIEDSLAKGERIVPEAEWSKLIAAAKAVKALPRTATDDEIKAAVTGAGFADMDDAAKSLRPAARLVESFMGIVMSTQMIIAAHEAGPAAAMIKDMADEATAKLRETVAERKMTRKDLEFLSTHSEECGLVLAMRMALAMKGLYSEE